MESPELSVRAQETECGAGWLRRSLRPGACARGRWPLSRRWWGAAHAAALSLCAGTALAADLQSRDDAWWTGPMLAASGASLPQGHFLIEPYLFDAATTGHIDASGNHHGSPA